MTADEAFDKLVTALLAESAGTIVAVREEYFKQSEALREFVAAYEENQKCESSQTDTGANG